MRTILQIALTLFLSTPLQAAIAFVNSDSQGPTGSDTTIACSALAVTTGNLLVVGVRWFNNANTISGIADTALNTFTNRIATVSQDDVQISVYDVQNATGNAADVITITFSASTAVREIVCLQYSGVLTSAALDQTCTGKASGVLSVSCSAGITTTQADEVLIEFSEHNNGGSDTDATWDTSFTEREDAFNSDGANFGAADRIVTSTQSFTPSVTWSANSAVTEIAFLSYKAAAASPAINPFILFGD